MMDDASSSLFIAAKAGDVATLDRAMHENEFAVEGIVNDEGDGLAHVATRKGHLQVCLPTSTKKSPTLFPFSQFLKRLVAAGVDIDRPNAKGRCLVHEAAQNAQLRVLKYLHSLNADFAVLTLEGPLTSRSHITRHCMGKEGDVVFRRQRAGCGKKC